MNTENSDYARSQQQRQLMQAMEQGRLGGNQFLPGPGSK